MGYHLNRLDEPVFMAGPKPMWTEFGIHHRLESCESLFIDSGVTLFCNKIMSGGNGQKFRSYSMHGPIHQINRMSQKP